MTLKTSGSRWNLRAGRLSSLLLLSVVSACVSASLEDAAPTQPTELDQSTAAQDSGTAGAVEGLQPQAGAVADDAKPERDTRFVEQGALRNSEYPTFANTPVGATEQLSADEKLLIEAEMSAIRSAYGSGGLSEAAYKARMRELEALARSHANEAKEEIEN